MSDIVSLLLLGIAVSLDSFTVGLTYGMRKISIPIRSMMIISTCTFFVLLIAMGIGTAIEQFMSYEAGETIGGLLLIGIGVWVLFQFFRSTNSDPKQASTSVKVFEIKSLGLIIQILKCPTKADMDRSGNISGIEALFLGLALSIDSFGAGVGAALIDLPPILFTIVVTACSAIFVIAGVHAGHIFRNFKWFKHISFIPGIVLILIGILKM